MVVVVVPKRKRGETKSKKSKRIEIIEVILTKKTIYLQRYVWFARGLSTGGRSGKRTGTKLRRALFSAILTESRTSSQKEVVVVAKEVVTAMISSVNKLTRIENTQHEIL